MTKIQAIRQFASTVANEPVAIKRTDEWASYVNHPYPYISVPKNLSVKDEGDRAFRRDFVSRCPMARGFADVTLSVLHELGHFFNRDSFDESQEEGEEFETHFSLPCEIIATNWAIEWLQSKENRRVAKAFEKEFFGTVR